MVWVILYLLSVMIILPCVYGMEIWLIRNRKTNFSFHIWFMMLFLVFMPVCNMFVFVAQLHDLLKAQNIDIDQTITNFIRGEKHGS